MVVLVIKKVDQEQFLYETSVTKSVDEVIMECVQIHNGRLKVERICYEIEELCKYGTMLCPEITGITKEQAQELHLKDIYMDKCAPEGYILNEDPVGRRCGYQPPKKLQDILLNSVEVAREIISKKHCSAGIAMKQTDISKALSELDGAVKITYPMKLPPYDPIREELENRENLDGTQASLEVLEPSITAMWYCGKQFMPGKLLSDHLGKNDKCKVVVKMCNKKDGPPAREPAVSEEERKLMMLHAYRRQEELKTEKARDQLPSYVCSKTVGMGTSLYGTNK